MGKVGHFLAKAMAVLALLTTGASPAAAKVLEESVVAGWQLAAIGEDDGRFVYCRISAVYRSNVELEMSVGPELHWAFSLRNDNWQLTKGEHYPIRVSVDNGRSIPLDAEAISEHTVFVWMDGEEFFNRFRQGRVLDVETANTVLSFDLSGTARAMSAMEDCVYRHNRAAQPSNPFVTPQQQNNAGKATASSSANAVYESPAERREVKEMMEQLLIAAGIKDFRMLKDHELPKGWEEYPAIWQAEGLFGGLYIQAVEEGTTGADVVSHLTSSDAAVCAGKFAADSDPDSGMQHIFNVYTACSDDQGSDMTYYTTFARADGGFYVIFTTALLSEWRSDENAGEVDQRIREVLFNLQ